MNPLCPVPFLRDFPFKPRVPPMAHASAFITVVAGKKLKQ